MKRVLTLLFCAPLCCSAATLYVNQNGIPPNTNSIAGLNSSWTNISPGDTISLSGTFTNNLLIKGSGTAGNPITIFFEPGAKFSRPTWGTKSPYRPDLSVPYTDAIIRTDPQDFLYSYVDIDGNGTWPSFEATENGQGRTYTNGFYAIWVTLSHSTIKNLSFTNMTHYAGATNAYSCTNCGDLTEWFLYPPAGCTGVRVDGPATNVTILNNVFDSMANSIYLVVSGGAPGAPIYASYTVFGNVMTRYNWAIGKLQSTDNSFVTALYASNRMDFSTNWGYSPNANNANNPNHGDGGFISTGTGTNIWDINSRFCYNYVGKYVSSLSSAALLYMDATHTAAHFVNFQIDNNISDQSEFPHGVSVPKILVNGSGTRIFNNTLLGSIGTYVAAGPVYYTNYAFGTAIILNAEEGGIYTNLVPPMLANNIVGNCGTLVGSLEHLTDKPTNTSHNVWFATATNSAFWSESPKWGYVPLGTTLTKFLSTWTNTMNAATDRTNNPVLDPVTLAPATNSYAAQNWKDLSAYGVTNTYIGAVNPGAIQTPEEPPVTSYRVRARYQAP